MDRLLKSLKREKIWRDVSPFTAVFLLLSLSIFAGGNTASAALLAPVLSYFLFLSATVASFSPAVSIAVYAIVLPVTFSFLRMPFDPNLLPSFKLSLLMSIPKLSAVLLTLPGMIRGSWLFWLVCRILTSGFLSVLSIYALHNSLPDEFVRSWVSLGGILKLGVETELFLWLSIAVILLFTRALPETRVSETLPGRKPSLTLSLLPSEFPAWENVMLLFLALLFVQPVPLH